MSSSDFSTAQTLAIFDSELANLGFSEERRTPLLVEALRHELPREGLTIDGAHLEDTETPADS